MTTLVSFERIFEVLDLVPMIEEAPDAVAIPRGPATVEFDHVDFSYPSAEDVSLASLEAVAVLESGPAARGAPRRLVPRRAGPDGGAGRTVGRRQDDHLRARPAPLRRRRRVACGSTASTCATPPSRRCATSIGVVTQDPHLFHDTLRANLLYARPEATDDELLAALEQAQILPLVASLPDGLDTLVGDRGYRLSGGEKQRVALARLILKAPDVVVLDEATAHLDSESEAAVQRALEIDAGRPDLARHRPPPLDRPRGRPAARRRRRPHRRAGHPRGAAGRRRPLRRAVPDPVRRPGRGHRLTGARGVARTNRPPD